ncbi:response regulator transcription factor [Pseudomonas sp. RtIB026]|uniref:response regulator transcription factor n=1 Tax=Pseudomonas sp. RtIB026 TaxID=2749999 RepID=UPI002B4BAE9C|nr:response regulator transcription factor [Pseudomonas sp. RtIB026]
MQSVFQLIESSTTLDLDGGNMGKPSGVIRVAMLDDHAVVRFGVAACIGAEPDIQVVGSYGSSREMIVGLRDAPADVLLVDYFLSPDEVDGVSLIRALVAKFPASRILIFSAHYDPAIVSLALRVGARGFVGKSQDLALVATSIRKVNSGKVFIDPDMAYRLVEIDVNPTLRPTLMPLAECDALRVEGVRLSVKESEVIRCFLAGLTVSEIARKFARSDKTISTQKWAAFRKLGVTSDAEFFKLKHHFGVY